MGWFGTSNCEGNINRMQEMKAGGAGHIKISNTFKKEGINIEPHQVKAIIECAEPLRSKALPKKVAKKAIASMHSVQMTATKNAANGKQPDGSKT